MDENDASVQTQARLACLYDIASLHLSTKSPPKQVAASPYL